MRSYSTECKAILIILVLIFIVLIFGLFKVHGEPLVISAPTKVYGDFDLSASKDSVTDIEEMMIKSEVEIRKGVLGLGVNIDFKKQQTEDEINDLVLDSGVQGNYFFHNTDSTSLYALLAFNYKNDQIGAYTRTDSGLGIGYRVFDSGEIECSNFFIEESIVLASIYPDAKEYSRDLWSSTEAGITIPLTGVFYLENNNSLRVNLENAGRMNSVFNDYELDTYTAFCTKLTENLALKLYHEWNYDHRPVEGTKDRRITGAG